MDQFSIACTTCQAKLRVRDASAIGQIVTCPKCGSMVLIEAPSSPGATQSAPTGTVPSTAKPPPRPGVAAVSQPTDAPIHAAVEKPALVESRQSAEDLVGGLAASAEEAVAKQDPTPAVDELPTTQDAEKIGIAETAAPESSGGRRWVLAALAGTTGALIAVTLFAVYAIVTAKNATPTLTANAEKLQPKAEHGKNVSEPVSVPTSSTPPPATPIERTQTQESPAEAQSKPTAIDDRTKPTLMPPSPAVEEPAAKTEVNSSPINTKAPLLNAPPGFAGADSDKSKADRLSGTESLSETLRKLGGLFDESAADVKPAMENSPPGAPEIEPPEAPAD